MNYFLLAEVTGSILYVTQKILLSFGKRIGWLFGLLGSIAFTAVTIHKGSFAYAVLEVTDAILFIFGLLLWQKREDMEQKATLFVSIIGLIGLVTVFLLNLGSPNWILENTMAMLFLVGLVFLVLRDPIGWILYVLGHIVLIAYAYILGTYFILALQVVSLPFAFIGYSNLRKAKEY